MHLRQRRDLDDALFEDEVENVPTSGALLVEEVQVIAGDGDPLLVVRARKPTTSPETERNVRSDSESVASGSGG